MRTITMTGRVAADAEKQSSRNGREYLSLRFVNSEFNDKEKDGSPKAYWFRVTSFQPNHFGMIQYLKKGKSIIVSGRYSDSLYTTKNGTTEISRDILADTIEFISTGEKQDDNGSSKEKQYNGPRNSETVPQVTNNGQPSVSKSAVSTEAPSTTPVSGGDMEDDELPF